MTQHGSSASVCEATPHVNNSNKSSKEQIEALAEMICLGGDQSAAALLVLMALLQESADPKAVANTAKHHAFTRCGELNAYGMVDAQIAMLERELLIPLCKA